MATPSNQVAIVYDAATLEVAMIVKFDNAGQYDDPAFNARDGQARILVDREEFEALCGPNMPNPISVKTLLLIKLGLA